MAMQNLRLLPSGKHGEGTVTGVGAQSEEGMGAEVGEGTSVETEAGSETSTWTGEDTEAGPGVKVTRQNSLSSKMSGLTRSVSLRMNRNACLVSDLQIDKDGVESALVRHWHDKNI